VAYGDPKQADCSKPILFWWCGHFKESVWLLPGKHILCPSVCQLTAIVFKHGAVYKMTVASKLINTLHDYTVALETLSYSCAVLPYLVFEVPFYLQILNCSVSQQFEKVSRISCTTKFVRESFHNPFIF
jgi:hypothetical protein